MRSAPLDRWQSMPCNNIAIISQFIKNINYVSSSFPTGVSVNPDGTALDYKIHHECEGGIEKSVPWITDWHHEA